ncbi:hypothetical protein CI102_7061 [Trichoderma harzianum]|nr:hypothetical protein CI102_7061 [Trichoderma harzianum]
MASIIPCQRFLSNGQVPPCLRYCSNRPPMFNPRHSKRLFFSRAITAQQIIPSPLEQIERDTKAFYSSLSSRDYRSVFCVVYVCTFQRRKVLTAVDTSRMDKTAEYMYLLPHPYPPGASIIKKIPTSQPRIAHLSHIPEY